MQVSKSLLTFGAVALCSVAISARAADSEADLKLREALRQKMAEVGPETSEPAPAPAKPAKVKAPKKVAPAPAEPAAAAAPVMSEPEPAKPALVVTPAPVVIQSAPVVAQPAPAAADSADVEHLRQALRARMQQETAAPPQPTPAEQPVVTQGSDLEPVVSTTKVVAPAAPAQTAPPVVAPVATPAAPEAPASPLPASKEARLAGLLQQYKADLITPQQYHEQRAKILAE